MRFIDAYQKLVNIIIGLPISQKIAPTSPLVPAELPAQRASIIPMQLPNLQEFRNYLNSHVVGQKELVNTLTLCLFKHALQDNVNDEVLLNNSSTLLLIGNTGTGKTYATRLAAEYLDVPFIELNSKAIVQEGFMGNSFINMLEKAMYSIWSHPNLDRAIIFLDEFDKMCMPQETNRSENHGAQIQSSLLKYVEGMQMHLNGAKFNSRRFCFIFAGTFKTVTTIKKSEIGFNSNTSTKMELPALIDRLLDWGVLEEFVGRIGKVVQLNDFTEEMYRELIFNPNTPSNKWLKFLTENHIEYGVPNYADIINTAYKNKLGARGFLSLFDEFIDKIIEKNSNILGERYKNKQF